MNPEKLYKKPEAVESFSSVYQILAYARDHYPEKAAYRQPVGKTELSEITFGQFASNVDALRAALLSHGLAGRHIALFGETSEEWIRAYLAVISGVGVAVPIDKELPPETVAAQLDFADAELVFCSAKCARKLSRALPLCKNTVQVAQLRGESAALEGIASLLSLGELTEEGRALLRKAGNGVLPAAVDPDAVCLILYTSGTTGANKGVMLTNRSIMGTLRGCARLLHYPDTSISVLPVNHSYELHAHLMSCLYCGTTVYLNDDLKHLLQNLTRFRPEMSCMVPVMLELIVKKLKKQIADRGQEETFRRTVRLSETLRKTGVDLRRRLFRPLLEGLGGNLSMIICGGAALRQETADFLDAIGIEIYNGYGITECSPVAAVNPVGHARRFSVGLVLPTNSIRIASPDERGCGEIQIRGDNVMRGYYKEPEDTKRVFTPDGWFRTGDLGRLDGDGYLYVSGRIKNLIILSNGKNVSPEEVERALTGALPNIRECVVYADASGAGIRALIYPDPDFCKAHNLASPEEIKAFMQADINAFNASQPGFKRIMDFEITEREFEKNTIHKIQRFKIDAVNYKKETTQNV